MFLNNSRTTYNMYPILHKDQESKIAVINFEIYKHKIIEE